MYASSTPADQPLSLAEYASLPEDDGCRTELVRGKLVREPGPAPLHGSVQAGVLYLLRSYAEQHGNRGFFSGPTNFVLFEEPPTVRIPDAAYVAFDRMPADAYSASM